MNAQSHLRSARDSAHGDRSGVSPTPPLVLTAAVAPVPELSLVLQLAALGGMIGGLVAARAGRRGVSADASSITSACAGLGLVIGALVVLAELLAA